MNTKTSSSLHATTWRQRAAAQIRALCASLAAVAALGIAAPVAKAEIITGYLDGVGVYLHNAWATTWPPDTADFVISARGRLYFSFENSTTGNPGDVKPLVGYFGFVSDVFSATTTLTAEADGTLTFADDLGQVSYDQLIFRGPRFFTGQWDIQVAGLQTVYDPNFNNFFITVSALFPTDAYQVGVLNSSTSLGSGDLVSQRNSVSGAALRDGVPTGYRTGLDTTSSASPGGQLVITSRGGNVPEPSVLALLAIAAMGAGLANKRRAIHGG
jgi:PEP-CTERM motif